METFNSLFHCYQEKLIAIGPISTNLTQERLQNYLKKLQLEVTFLDITSKNIIIAKAMNSHSFRFLTEIQRQHKIEETQFYTEDVKDLKKNFKNRVFVVKIPISASEEKIEEFFASFGKIVYTSISLELRNSSTGLFTTGYVEYDNPETAQKVRNLRMLYYKGKEIFMREYEPKYFRRLKRNTDFPEKEQLNLLTRFENFHFHLETESYVETRLIKHVNKRHFPENLGFNMNTGITKADCKSW